MAQSAKNKLKPKGMVISPQNYNFNQFWYGKFYALKTLRIDRRTWLHVPSGTHWSTSSETHQVVEIWKETSTKIKDVKIHVFVKHYALGGNKVQTTILA